MPGVTARPSGGSTNPHPASVPPTSDLSKNDVPGGRKLWKRLIAAFLSTAVCGGAFILVGAMFFQSTYDTAMKDGSSLPMVMCIIAIVVGGLMILGSLYVGRLLISNKWRHNRQPVYRGMSLTRAHFVAPAANTDAEGTVQLDMPQPPLYEDNYTRPPESNPPPAYTPRQLDVTELAASSAALPVENSVTFLPSYEDSLLGFTPPPEFDDVDRTRDSNGD